MIKIIQLMRTISDLMELVGHWDGPINVAELAGVLQSCNVQSSSIFGCGFEYN